jgi:UDP-N-acetyl-D-galactosamine dehydrogenase
LGGNVCHSKIGILGLTFKENCPDIRNTKVVDIINELKEYTPNIVVHDPHADKTDAKHEYDIDLVELDTFKDLAAIVVAVGHEEFSVLTASDFKKMLNGIKLVVDVKGRLDKQAFKDQHIEVIRI